VWVIENVPLLEQLDGEIETVENALFHIVEASKETARVGG
jgi:hypothetical protein